MNRRKFRGQASGADVNSIPLLNTLLNLQLAGSIANAAPSTIGEHQTSRGNLALAQASLLPTSPINNPGRTFGVHPSMPNLTSRFQVGDADCFHAMIRGNIAAASL